MNEQPKKVFGLSIDETIDWYLAYVTRDGILSEPRIEQGRIPIPEDTDRTISVPVLIETNLLAGLRELNKRDPSFFQNIGGIGISTIGVVDTQRNAVEDIARKNWKKRNSKDDSIDFGSIFCQPKKAQTLFKPWLGMDQIRIQNDSSARALAEYRYGQPDHPDRLFYIAAGEGVNAAAVVDGKLITGIGNSEASHWMPQLHPEDADFKNADLSGCSSHIRCIEGLCARHRFRAEWGKELWQLPDETVPSVRDRTINPRDIFVFYMSQMAYTAALVFNPTRIVFAGHLFWGEAGNKLITAIKARFVEWNNEYIRRFRAGHVDDLICKTRLNDSVKKYAALIMAQHAAYGDLPSSLAR